VELEVALPVDPAVVTVQRVSAPLRIYGKGLARSLAGLSMVLLTPAAKEVDTKGDDSAFDFFRQGSITASLGGRGGFSSSASIQSGNPKEWAAVTKHTIACCSTQVVDITPMKHRSTSITSLEWYNRNICESKACL
jgi:hypothetical protein